MLHRVHISRAFSLQKFGPTTLTQTRDVDRVHLPGCQLILLNSVKKQNLSALRDIAVARKCARLTPYSARLPTRTRAFVTDVRASVLLA